RLALWSKNGLNFLPISSLDLSITVAEFESLCLFDGDALACGYTTCEATPPLSKHARLFNAPLPYKRNVSGATTDIDEDSSAVGTCVRAQTASQGIRFCHNRDQLQVQSLCYCLQCP